MRSRLVIGSTALLAIAFVVNALFLHTTLSDGYQISEVKRYLRAIEAARHSIEWTLGNNSRQSIDDIRALLHQQKQVIDRHWQNTVNANPAAKLSEQRGLVDLMLLVKSGSKLVTTANKFADQAPPKELIEQIGRISSGRSLAGLSFVEDNSSYYVPYMLFDKQDRWFLSLVFQFEKGILRYSVSPLMDAHLLPTAIVAILTTAGILWFCYRLVRARNSIRKKDFVAHFVTIMLVSLACSLLINTVTFQRKVLEVSEENARQTVAEISEVLNKKLSPRETRSDPDIRRPAFSEYFGRYDNFEYIMLTDDRDKVVFRHDAERTPDSTSKSLLKNLFIGHLPEKQFSVIERLNGIKLKNGSDVTAVVRISKDDIHQNTLPVLVEGVTVLFLTTLVMVEGLLLYLHLLARRKTIGLHAPRYEIGFVRPAMFVFLFAIDLSLSFLPLHMQLFDEELFGLSKDIVSGLPISVEFLCVGIFLLIAGIWIDRRGWHEPFFIGLVAVGLGNLFSWLTESALIFILSRALVGAGYGLALMSAQGIVIRYGGRNGRARGFAGLFAGLYSGSICGAAVGAILAERLGYGKVFFIGAVIILPLIAFSWIFLRTVIDPCASETKPAKQTRHRIDLVPLLRLLGNPVFVALNLLSSLPAAIAVAGFLHYFTPVYLDQIGVRDSTIGQVLIIYGICLISLGPSIGRLIDRSDNKKYFMLAGGVLGGLGLVTFNTDFGIASMIVSVFLLGLSSCFVLSSQSTIVLELSQSRELGESTALGIFRSISRIGQVIGPMIFGWILITGDLTEVINLLGYCYIGAMLILAAFVIKHPGKLEQRKLALRN